MADAWDLLSQGKIFDSMIAPYSNLFGADMLYLMLFATLVGLIYIKTKNIGIISIVFILGGSAFMSVITPSAKIYFLMIIILGVVLGIYQLLYRKYYSD